MGGKSVYRAKEDPNHVLVLHSSRTMVEAEAFARGRKKLPLRVERRWVRGAGDEAPFAQRSASMV